MKKRGLATLLAIAVILGALPAAQAAGGVDTVYLNQSAANGGTGTQASPVNTMEKAVAAVKDGGVILLQGLVSLRATDESSWAFTLPKSVTIGGVDGTDPQLSTPDLNLLGNLTLENLTLYLTLAGKHQRVYANGHDLTLRNVRIGNPQGDARGLTVVAGAYTGDVTIPGGTQRITIDSGRVSAIYAGGVNGTVTGDVQVALSGAGTQFLALAENGYAGIYAKSVDGKALQGNFSLAANSLQDTLPEIHGGATGVDTVKLDGYGYFKKDLFVTGLDQLSIANSRIAMNRDSLAQCQGLTVGAGAVLMLPTGQDSGLPGTLKGEGGTLELTAGRKLTVGGPITGTLSLKMEGKPVAGELITGHKDSNATITLADTPYAVALNTTVDTLARWTLHATAQQLQALSLKVVLDEMVLPGGMIETSTQEFFLTCTDTAGKPMDQLSTITLDSNYQKALSLSSKSGYGNSYSVDPSERFVPAGDMTVTGSAEKADGTMLSASKTVRFIVAPRAVLTADAETIRPNETATVRMELVGAKDFAGTVAFKLGEAPPESVRIENGNVATKTFTELALGTHKIEATFTPDDTTYYKSATADMTLTVTDKIIPTGTPKVTPVSQNDLDFAIRTLDDVEITGTFSVAGSVAWEDASALVLPMQPYRWVFTPADTDAYAVVRGTAKIWKSTPVVTVTPSGAVAGAELSTVKLDGTAYDPQTGGPVAGRFAWSEPERIIGEGYSYAYRFTPTDLTRYDDKLVFVTPLKRTPNISVSCPTVVEAGATLGDLLLSKTTDLKTGILRWQQGSGTPVEQGVAYTWVFTPGGDTHGIVTGTLTPWKQAPAITKLKYSVTVAEDGRSASAALTDCTAKVGDTPVEGTLVWAQNSQAALSVDTKGWYTYRFTPTNPDYVPATGQVYLWNPELTGTANTENAVTTEDKTLADAGLVGQFFAPGNVPVEGTLCWVSGNATKVERNKAYTWKFTPTDATYPPQTGTIVVWMADDTTDPGEPPDGGGSGGGGGGQPPDGGGGQTPDSGSGGGGGGGGGGGLPAIPPAGKPTAPAKPQIGNNVPGTHWARNAMETLIEKGLVRGNETGKVYIDETCTREECIAILVRMLGLTVDSNAPLSPGDQTSAWAAGYVAAAKQAELIQGDERGGVSGARTLSRAEAVAMLARLKKLPAGKEETLSAFGDAAAIPAWLRPYAGAMVESGALTGLPDGTLSLSRLITRGELFSLICRTMGWQ